MTMKKQKWTKKIRGKKNKEHQRRYNEWVRYHDEVDDKAITDVGPDSFVLHMPSGLHVPPGDYTIARKKYAFLQASSDEDLQKVLLIECDDEYHGDMIEWPMLGEMIGFKQLVDAGE